ncbi:MAG: chalcone isomerase family protein, partial [Gammaproteobacteria bacterium]|nr:chalcone isomerase family protein [Gammaproteobacteria bacterium]
MKFYNSYVLYVLALIVSVMSANVSEAASVELDEVATVSLGGEQLKLKGTATKNHSHQAVYVGGLYAPDDINTAEEILNDDG